MSKSTTMLLGALLLTGSVYASTPDYKSVARDFMSGKSQESLKTQPRKAKSNPGSQPAAASVAKTAMKSPTRALDIVYNAPEGKVRNMMRSGVAYYSFLGDVTMDEYFGMCGEIVECANGDVYVKEAISQAPITNSYIKGRRDGSEVYFTLPQATLSLPNEDGGRDYFYVSLFQWSDEYTWYFRTGSQEAEMYGVPDIENEWVLEVDDDGNYTYGGRPEDEGVILGLYSDLSAQDAEMGSWLSYGELASVWEDFTDTPVEAPADIEFQPMAMHYEDGAYFVSMGFEGNDVYFKGLFRDLPQSVVKGRLDGDKIIVEPGQYVGITTLFTGISYYSYLKTARAERIWDTEYNLWETTLYPTESFIFNYDKENQKLTTAEESGTLVLNCGNVTLFDAAYVMNPRLSRQEEGFSLNPASPYNVDFVRGIGQPHLEFGLPLTNVNGDVLDINNLYYRIYIDGEEFTFYNDEYPEVTEGEMTLVPYNFDTSNTSDQNFMVYGKNHTIYFYLEDVETYGVQLVYVEDGEIRGESDIVTIAAETNDASTPRNPEDLCFDEMMMPYGIYSFTFRIYDRSLDNTKLAQENLYYKVLVNGEEVTFYPKDYPCFLEPTTLIPFSFTDDNDELIICSGSIHSVDFDNADARTYGVQLFYIVDDVILGKSDVITMSGPNYTNGVEAVKDEIAKEAVSVKYYNISGAEVSEPTEGICIKVETYSDGSSRSFKMVLTGRPGPA